MRVRITETEDPEINLIALIDCIFFLLLFFMVATSFQREDKGSTERKGLPITLPDSAVSLDAGQAQASPLVLGVDRKGGVYVSRTPVSLEELRKTIHEQAQADPARPVRIDGDASVPYQEVVHLLDLCQFEGMTHITMRTRDGS
jgi:biopolymer transport protein ExbD